MYYEEEILKRYPFRTKNLCDLIKLSSYWRGTTSKWVNMQCSLLLRYFYEVLRVEILLCIVVGRGISKKEKTLLRRNTPLPSTSPGRHRCPPSLCLPLLIFHTQVPTLHIDPSFVFPDTPPHWLCIMLCCYQYMAGFTVQGPLGWVSRSDAEQGARGCD